jgi:hypothetical protein
MIEDFEDFDEQTEEEATVTPSSNNTPFYIVVGVLTVTFLICAITAAVLSFSGGDGPDPSVESTRVAILTRNAAIATQNADVTKTIESMLLTQNAPTNTPTSTPVPDTPTPTPTNTPTSTPTNTPVVNVEDAAVATQEAVAAAATETVAAILTQDPDAIIATATFDFSSALNGNGNSSSGNGGIPTPTPFGATGSSGSSSSNSSSSNNGSSSSSTLPQTGLGLWGIIGTVLSLLFVFVVVRQVRNHL